MLLSCEEVLDESTGLTRLQCPQEEPHVCFDEPQEVVDSCLNYGGEPFSAVDVFGCPFTKCELAGYSEEEVFLEKECLSDEQINLYSTECAVNGLKVALDVGLDGCFAPRCGGIEESLEDSCEAFDFGEIAEIEKNCSVQLGSLAYEYDEAGCKTPVCRSLGESSCYQVPEETTSLCMQSGGEMVVLKDEIGCVTYSTCLIESDQELEFEPVVERPTDEDLRATTNELKELEGILQVIIERLDSLSVFFEQSGDTASLNKVAVAKSMLEGSLDKLENMISFLEQNLGGVTVEDLSNARKELGLISENMQGVLFVLLSPADVQESSCGSNEQCLQKNLSQCRPSSANLVQDAITFNVEIKGIENERCVLNVGAVIDNENVSMVCRYAGYHLGIVGGNEVEGFLESCEGNLLEYMYQLSGVQ